MKTIGLIGGMSWESSAHYYRILNQAVRDRLGSAHSAKIVMVSMDFHEIERLQHQGDWSRLAEMMAAAAVRLQGAGADGVLICSNTMHAAAPAVAAALTIPLLHIADPAARAVRAAGLARVGLLGTAFTMEQPFYRQRMMDAFQLEVLIPSREDRQTVHDIIYRELIAGVINPASRDAFRGVMSRLAAAGAEAIVLGCTEIMLLVGPEDSPAPLFDTTELHALAAVDWALASD